MHRVFRGNTHGSWTAVFTYYYHNYDVVLFSFFLQTVLMSPLKDQEDGVGLHLDMAVGPEEGLEEEADAGPEEEGVVVVTTIAGVEVIHLSEIVIGLLLGGKRKHNYHNSTSLANLV